MCGGISFVLIIYGLGGSTGSGCDLSEPRTVESLGQFKLPPSAKLLRTNCGGMQGMWAEAHFEMLPSDLAVFLSSTSIKPPLLNTGKPDKLWCGCSEEVKAVTSYLYGSYEVGSDWLEEVFIDTSDPTLYKVYFTVLGG